MARAEIAAAAGDETGGSRFASPALRAAFARSGAQLAGILCALLGLAMLVALLSHDPADPSGSTATARAATNLAGPTGAAVSDTLLQAFGLAAFLPAITLLAWAWRLFTERGVTLLPARLMALLLGMPVLAAGFSALPLPPAAPVLAGAGGAFGPLMAHAATGWLQSSFGPLGALLANGLLALTSALVLLGALGFAPAEWRRAAFATADATAHVARAGAARRHLFWRAFSALGRFTLWLFGRGRGRGVKPGADLSSLLRAADEAAERVPERREPALASAAAKPSPRVATPAARSAEKPRQATLDLQPIEGGITIPPLELLQAAPPRTSSGPDSAALQANARRLEQVLADFGVSGEITEIRPGPVVTLYELEPAPGV